MLQLRLSEEAQNDLREIRAFTKQQWGTAQSSRYLKEIQVKIELLSSNPLIGLDRSDDLKKGLRSLLVNSHVIYYRHDEKNLIVQAILHHAMAPIKHYQRKATT